ncbi:hypothetical protein [Cellulomonas hominis]
MRRSIIATLTSAGVWGVMFFAAAAPAQALSATSGATICTFTVSTTSNSVTANKGTCSQVQASINYVDNGGTQRGSTGAVAATSTAKAGTLMVTSRLVKVWVGGGSPSYQV